MSAVAEIPALESVRKISDAVLDYLEKKRKAPAAEIIAQVERQFPMMSATPIVTAIWRLSDENLVRIADNWMIELIAD